MLILTRRAGEAILLAGGIRVSVIATERGQVRLGIEAPPEITILRQEIVDDITAGTVAAVATPEALKRLGLRPPQALPAVLPARSKRRASASVGADQNTSPIVETASTDPSRTRKEKRSVPSPSTAASQAAKS
ncbi:MAG: carbon storage regulator [Gemmatimonadaceae bacterium]|nr:carbon storage regulator [Gemmatimonadaceae bacterium]